MVKLPQFLNVYQENAKQLIQTNGVKEVEFSGPTYQIHIDDPQLAPEGAWAFLQLEAKGKIKDSFCSCDEVELSGACPHLAAAYLTIFGEYSYPLHQRFERSLWNVLFRLFASKLGYENEVLKEETPNCFIYRSVTGKELLRIEARDAEGIETLRRLIKERAIETEETSLKFSNLSEKEIHLWREGRPSLELMYRLSFWNDFAKWAMLEQEMGKLEEIKFHTPPGQLPNGMRITFDHLSLDFYLAEANLPKIIPALKDINSEYTVVNFEEELVEDVFYEEKTGLIRIKHKKDYKEKQMFSLNESIEILPGVSPGQSKWIFVPERGFFKLAVNGILGKETLAERDVNKFFNEHLSLLKTHITKFSIHEKPIELSYTLFFDTRWNLHIDAYLYEKGDLTEGTSRSFGDWVFLEGDGFYRLIEKRFDKIQTIIPKNKVDAFVSENRLWLNSQEGFEPHMTHLETELNYVLNDEGCLRFDTQAALEVEETPSQKDFGTWIYIANQGFFSKISRSLELPLKAGTVVYKHNIPLFIRMNEDELWLVPNFFSEKCPVLRSYISLEVNDDESLVIHPRYEMLPEYDSTEVSLFEDYTYVEGEGFHEIPYEKRLPEAFRQEQTLKGEDRDFFLAHEMNELGDLIQVDDPKLMRPVTSRLLVHQISEENNLGKGWLNFKMDFKTDEGKLPIVKLWEAIHQGKRFLFTEAGLIDLNNEQFHWLRHLAKGRLNTQENQFALSTLEFNRLVALEQFEAPSGDKGKVIQKQLDDLITFENTKLPDLSGLKSELRPYQEKGVQWLWHLYLNNLSGLLCDDMGLGKTHQSMALIAALVSAKKQADEPSPKFLVVCPTSVMFHWYEKILHFLPGLRVRVYHGLTRSLEGFSEYNDLLLTSYGVLRRDIESIQEIPFELIVMDEIQVAKNHTSRLFHALEKVQAVMRLGLTGTPVENHVRELKALFDLVIPSYMPRESAFREFFLKPIEKENDLERKQLLSKIIRPFIMRRKKEQVLTDLPEKIEEISHCALSDEQKRLYSETLMLQRERLYELLKDTTQNVPYLHIFALLSSLKQICNHPALFLKKTTFYKEFTSGKWDLFLELLNEARESSQKVVIFTQFLGMLDIFESYLTENKIGHVTIKGATKNRGEILKRFNTDPNCEVFLGSLQAVGLGVDLTAGSVVIHYDRWWNAAREDQATDRVHRIGQTRGVQVFKLVTKGTFEERIDELITNKGLLMEDVVGTDAQDVVKQLNREELLQLLQFTDQDF